MMPSSSKRNHSPRCFNQTCQSFVSTASVTYRFRHPDCSDPSRLAEGNLMCGASGEHLTDQIVLHSRSASTFKRCLLRRAPLPSMDHPGTACQLLCPQQPQNSNTLQSTKSANADKPTFEREREGDEIANAQKPTFERKRSNKPSSRTENNKQTDELTKPGAAQELPAGQDEAAKLSGIPVSVSKDDTAVPMLP